VDFACLASLGYRLPRKDNMTAALFTLWIAALTGLAALILWDVLRPLVAL
jgi:hypothetical protein